MHDRSLPQQSAVPEIPAAVRNPLRRSAQPQSKRSGRSIVFASGRQVSSRSLFLWLHWGGWCLFAAIPFAWSVNAWGWIGALLNNSVFLLTGAVLTLALRNIYHRVRTVRLSYAIVAPAVLIGCAVLAEVWFAVELSLSRLAFTTFLPLMGGSQQFAHGLSLLSGTPYLISAAAWYVYAFALITWSSLYFGINSIIDLELERARVAAALKLAESAQLRVLQSQLNPHFLFNALNGIATFVREGNAAGASKMISTLSGSLRATLGRLDVPKITISEELVFLDQYIELQQLRFGERLRVDVDVQEDTYSALIPTLMLQPLVENAVQHGVLLNERGGCVSIEIRRSGDNLHTRVEDDGPGSDTVPPKFGVGLSNTAERLRTLYGENATMSIGRAARGGFAVQLSIPFQEAELISRSAAAIQARPKP